MRKIPAEKVEDRNVCRCCERLLRSCQGGMKEALRLISLLLLSSVSAGVML